MKLKNLVYGAMVAVMLITTGCASETDTAANTDTAQHSEHAGHTDAAPASKEPVKINDKQVRLANGDLQEVTASIDELPTFLQKAKPETIEAYRHAAKANEVLDFIPCYCGCGVHAGHKNNKHCFIKEIKPDKSVVWDDHGTRCATCMTIAVTSSKLKDSGKTTKEIRSIIDNQYKTGYDKPTPTPMPN